MDYNQVWTSVSRVCKRLFIMLSDSRSVRSRGMVHGLRARTGLKLGETGIAVVTDGLSRLVERITTH